MDSAYAVSRLRRRWPARDSTLAIAQSLVSLVRLWRERRSRRLLAAMSERELQDIGICRADIADEIGKPFWCPLS